MSQQSNSSENMRDLESALSSSQNERVKDLLSDDLLSNNLLSQHALLEATQQVYPDGSSWSEKSTIPVHEPVACMEFGNAFALSAAQAPRVQLASIPVQCSSALPVMAPTKLHFIPKFEDSSAVALRTPLLAAPSHFIIAPRKLQPRIAVKSNIVAVSGIPLVRSPENGRLAPSTSPFAPLPSSHKTVAPGTDAFPGQHQFDVKFEVGSHMVTIATQKFSEKLNRFYIKMDDVFEVSLLMQQSPPAGAYVRTMVVYADRSVAAEPVLCCHNHEKTQPHRCFFQQKSPHIDPTIDPSTGHVCVVSKLKLTNKSLACSGLKMLAQYHFLCTNACQKGRKKNLLLVFTLEHDGVVMGRRIVELKVCSSPGRDFARDEAGATSSPPVKRKTDVSASSSGTKKRRHESAQSPSTKSRVKHAPANKGEEKVYRVEIVGRQALDAAMTALNKYDQKRTLLNEGDKRLKAYRVVSARVASVSERDGLTPSTTDEIDVSVGTQTSFVNSSSSSSRSLRRSHSQLTQESSPHSQTCSTQSSNSQELGRERLGHKFLAEYGIESLYDTLKELCYLHFRDLQRLSPDARLQLSYTLKEYGCQVYQIDRLMVLLAKMDKERVSDDSF